MTWYLWLLTVWISICLGFIIGAVWTAYFREIEKVEPEIKEQL